MTQVPLEPMPLPPCHLGPIPSIASIAVSGADAESFLAAQLSQAPPERGGRYAPLAGWHDAKGRVQALFRVLGNADGFLLLTHASVAADVTESLRRYVLRAHVRLQIGAPRDAAVAIVGDCGDWLRAQRIELGATPGASAEHEGVVYVRLGTGLLTMVTPAGERERLSTELHMGTAADAELAEIRLGLPTLSAALRGLFLPQMLNLDLLGGVAFDKGCFPGQEIIARTQHLGSVKRRMLRFTAESELDPPVAGSRLLDTSGAAAGIVVRAAPADLGAELLAVTQLEAARAELVCERAPNTPLRLATLPYPIPGIVAD
jgi:tRNA-modifying protein YgfZ